MLSFKRFFSITAFFLFLIIIALFYVPNTNSLQLEPINTDKVKSVRLKKFISDNLLYHKYDDYHINKVTIPLYKPKESKVIEIEESLIHRVSLIFYEAGRLKALNWYKCNTNNDVNLNTNPYFIFENGLPNDIYIVTAGLSTKVVPVQLHNFTGFYFKKSNQEIIRIITIILLVIILLCCLFVFIKLKNGYSLYLSFYVILCLGTSLSLNGFTNNLWLLDSNFFYDHSLGIMLSIHNSAMALFIYFLFDQTKTLKKIKLIALTNAIISVLFILMCIKFNSYFMLKYLMSFSIFLNLLFIAFYPQFFIKHRSKNAYWINYSAAILALIFFTIFLLKIFNVINGGLEVEIIEKLLFIGHLTALFTAFVLINKRGMIDAYLNEKGNFKYPVKENNLINEILLIPKPVLDLSNREYKVFELIAKGYKDQEIADLLYISITTVKTHKQRVYKKLEINNRSQATQIYLNYTSKTVNFINN